MKCSLLNVLTSYHRSTKNGIHNEISRSFVVIHRTPVDDILLRANAIPFMNFEISFSKMDCVVLFVRANTDAFQF